MIWLLFKNVLNMRNYQWQNNNLFSHNSEILSIGDYNNEYFNLIVIYPKHTIVIIIIDEFHLTSERYN